MRLRNLTVAIFDYAGYLKPLKHVPMLLVGGIRAWCEVIQDRPLRQIRWDIPSANSYSSKPPLTQNSRVLTDVTNVERRIVDLDLDLDAESQWLESLQSERYSRETI